MGTGGKYCGARPNRKGVGYEREFAKLVDGKRVVGSGAHADHGLVGDVKAHGKVFEVKYRASGFAACRWLDRKDIDRLALREPGGAWFVVLRLDDYLEVVNDRTGVLPEAARPVLE